MNFKSNNLNMNDLSELRNTEHGKANCCSAASTFLLESIFSILFLHSLFSNVREAKNKMCNVEKTTDNFSIEMTF